MVFGGVFLLNEVTSNKTGVTEEIVATSMKKYLHKKVLLCSTLEVYNETPIFIPIFIAEDFFNWLQKNYQVFWAPVVRT